MGRRILIVEDDPETADWLEKGLGEEGYLPVRATTGREAIFHATGGEVDAIVLDRMLPELDGLSALRSIRAAGVTVPVLVLSALGAVDERVRGLRAGADDYLVKPFAFAELAARLEALLRRPAEAREETVLACADLELDLVRRMARRGARQIQLQPREFQMLEYMMRRQGRVITRTMLLEGVWEYHFDPRTNVIDVHISRLRRKIDAPGETPLIHTVRGAGYRLSAEA